MQVAIALAAILVLIVLIAWLTPSCSRERFTLSQYCECGCGLSCRCPPRCVCRTEGTCAVLLNGVPRRLWLARRRRNRRAF
jgi:hypothetical protein